MNGNNDYSLRNRNNINNTSSGNTIAKDVSLRDFLYKQIDYMMTVESREIPAEGRRGTHVEVCLSCLVFYKRKIREKSINLLSKEEEIKLKSSFLG